MPGYKNFALVGAGLIGGVIADELLKAKSNGTIDKLVILSRPVSIAFMPASYLIAVANEHMNKGLYWKA